MPESDFISVSRNSSSDGLSNATTICQSASSAGSESSCSQQQSQNEVEKKPTSPYAKLSPDTMKAWGSRVLNSQNVKNVANVDNEDSGSFTIDDKTEASNTSCSPPDSDVATAGISLSSITSSSNRIALDETYKMIKTFRPLSQELEDIILPEQRALIELYVKKGRHLVAMAQAVRFSCDFAFEGNYKESFIAKVHAYRLGEEDESLGIELIFRKRLTLDLRKYIARRLLRGLLLRYPERSFPRTFRIVEADKNPVEKRTILLINDAIGTDDVYELDRKTHNILIKQWWEDFIDGPRVATEQ